MSEAEMNAPTIIDATYEEVVCGCCQHKLSEATRCYCEACVSYEIGQLTAPQIKELLASYLTQLQPGSTEERAFQVILSDLQHIAEELVKHRKK